jgi:uncharacterized protein YqeY
MTLKERIQADLIQAMKAQDKQKLAALRLVSAAFKQVEVDERIDVDDPRALQILDKLAKQRKESIAQFKLAAREDLVAQEEYELALLGAYLPAPLSDAEVNAQIEQAIQTLDAKNMSEMGKVMNQLKPQLQGRCDMAKVSAMIKARLQ